MLFLYLERDYYHDRAETMYVWLVRHDTVKLAQVDMPAQMLADDVRRLRAQLDPTAGEKIDPALAYALSTKLVPFNSAMLAGASSLLVVPDGPLQSLPLSVLVMSDPEGEHDPVEVDWLVRHHATTTLPSVSSLKALRSQAGQSPAIDPFRGIGNPLLAGSGRAGRGVAAASMYGTRGLGDPEMLRALPSLPETADELRFLAKSLGADRGFASTGRCRDRA